MYNSLTDEQRLVVETTDDLFVIAGPGSGKTRTLVAKVKRLLELGIPAEKILVLTFSLKACLELRKRFAKEGFILPKIDTFHGFAYDLLRERTGKSPKILTEKERNEVLKRLFPGLKDPLSQEGFKAQYFTWLEKNELYDFDFLIYKGAKEEQNYEGFYLVIDEFQDLTPQLFPLLSKFKEATWILFGDPNQAIYGFGGSKLGKLKSFLLETKPGLRGLYLTLSFRCPDRILNLSEAFKTSPWFVPSARSRIFGGEVLGYLSPDEETELATIARKVKSCMGGLGLEVASQAQIPPEDIFILARLKVLLQPVKKYLSREGIPFSLPEEKAKEFYKLINELIQSALLTHLPVHQAVKGLPPELQSYLNNLYELFSQDKEKFLSYLRNLKEDDLTFPATQGIQLMSIHASKGLEAKVVILIGAEEGVLPLTIFKETDLDEEKRLLYVALTRTKEKFYFFSQKQRKVYGRTLGSLSPFFIKFPLKSLTKPKPKPKQEALF